MRRYACEAGRRDQGNHLTPDCLGTRCINEVNL